MKWALIITITIIAGFWIASVLTYPEHQQTKEKELKEKHLDEKNKGMQIYRSSCATDCHRELNLSAMAEPSRYTFAQEKAIYAPNIMTSQKWWEFLYKPDVPKRCVGIDNLDGRTKELLYVYLRDTASDNDENSVLLKQFYEEDLAKSVEILGQSDGGQVFAKICAQCHREEFVKSFTSVEWILKINQLGAIHEKEKLNFPTKEETENLLKYLRNSAAVNSEDAKVIRKLTTELRQTKTSVKPTEKEHPTSEIPAEISWVDLDWQYDFAKGFEGLISKFAGKPVLLELTNRFS